MQNNVQYTIQDQSWYSSTDASWYSSTDAAWDGLFLTDRDNKKYTQDNVEKTMQNVFQKLERENFGNGLGVVSENTTGTTQGISMGGTSAQDYNINIYTKIFKILEVMAIECKGVQLDQMQQRIKNSESYKLFLKHFGFNDSQDISKLEPSQKKSLMLRIMNFIPRVERGIVLKVGSVVDISSEKKIDYDYENNGNYYKAISHYKFADYLNNKANNAKNLSIKYIDNKTNQNLQSLYEAIYGGYKEVMNFNKIVNTNQSNEWYIKNVKDLLQKGQIEQNQWGQIKQNM